MLLDDTFGTTWEKIDRRRGGKKRVVKVRIVCEVRGFKQKTENPVTSLCSYTVTACIFRRTEIQILKWKWGFCTFTSLSSSGCSDVGRKEGFKGEDVDCSGSSIDKVYRIMALVLMSV